MDAGAGEAGYSAAKKRWETPTPKAIFGAPEKPIHIADIEVPCFVLEDERRVITASLTRVGLIALIDEATGYQQKRDKDELQQILAAYVLPEQRPWMQTIPDEFTAEVYRVYGWKRQPNNRGPRYAGKLIRQLIYERMPQPVLPKLDELNPTNKNYQRKRRHHQFLIEKQGLDHFRTQVITVMTLLRISQNKSEFRRHLESYFGGQLSFNFDE